jgi:glycosyltransferase involved in cell wall biosynthesis
MCRQGISWERDQFETTPERRAQIPLRLAFLGRFHATKGPHIVVQALRDNPDLPVQLDLFGVRQGEAGDRYAAQLSAMIADDARIRMLPPIPSAHVIARLRHYDAVVVPSQWLETGPLVVLESFAARTPVIGSDLGGIAELVTGGVDGLLVEPFDSGKAWAGAFRLICNDPAIIDRLRRGIRPPRHSKQAALELMPVYEDMLRVEARSTLVPA